MGAGRIYLFKGNFQFVDATLKSKSGANKLGSKLCMQLEALTSRPGSYLKLWQEYNKLEQEAVIEEARGFGFCEYSMRENIGDNIYRFYLGKNSVTEKLRNLIKRKSEEHLSAVSTLPEYLIPDGKENEYPSEEPILPEYFRDDNSGRRKKERNEGKAFYGTAIAQKGGLLEMKMDCNCSVNPPEEGYIILSTYGDGARLDRREKARELIENATCAMPQLGLILEERTPPVRRRKREEPLSESAKRAFGGEPTFRQVEALRVALNTPDIAVIQGPPGTGKTKTIAALQTRLAEIAKDKSGIAGQYLLSSFQHEAVTNVAKVTNVLGLPTVKIGEKSGKTGVEDGVKDWIKEKSESLRASLASSNETSIHSACKKCRDLTVKYMRGMIEPDEERKIVDEMIVYSRHFVHSSLLDRLFEFSLKKKRVEPASFSSSKIEMAEKAVRGIRDDEAGFSDDGNTQAYKALRRLEGLSILEKADIELLEKARNWNEGETLSFLNELKNLKERLLDKLKPVNEPVRAQVNDELVKLLFEIVEALTERVKSGSYGIDSVIEDFCDSLENDPGGCRKAIKHYTTVLAATCQQSVSKEMLSRKENSNLFDTVVVDEAARANPLDLLIPMSIAANRIILVGDHRQLPHILDHKIEKDIKCGVGEKTRDMLSKSLFERLFNSLQQMEKEDGIKRTVTLDRQYRMHPVLAEFVSKTFYERYGEGFQSGVEKENFHHSISGYKNSIAAWVEIPGSRGGETKHHSISRKVEAEWIAEEANRILEEAPELSLGVISFYSAQVKLIMEEMRKTGLTVDDAENGLVIGSEKERLRVGTVDAFQGLEFDVIILSMTRSNGLPSGDYRSIRRKYGHLVVENRLCVAMSRQKRLLIVVGDSGMLEPEAAKENIPGLVEFMKLCEGEHGVKLHI